MKFYILTIALVLTSVTSFAQEILNEQEIKLRTYLSDKREVYPIVNQESGDIVLFLMDNDTINVQVYNQAFDFIKSYRCKRPNGKYKHLLGHTIENDNYNLFFTNKRNKEFLVKTVNYNKEVSEEKKVPIKLSKEEYLEAICYKNKFYVLSRIFTASIYKLRVFEDCEMKICVEHDFSNILPNKINSNVILDDLYDTPEPVIDSNFEKIVNGDPNPLDITSNDKKIYCHEDKMLLTFDDDDDMTLIVSIDLESFSLETKTFTHGGDVNNTRVLSNSYLYDNKLFQLKVSKNELCLRIQDFKTEQILKEYRVGNAQDIDFKNSSLIQAVGSGAGGREKELEKTKQVLRKLLSGAIGISVYPNKDILQLTVGGINEHVSPSTGDVLLAGLFGALAVPLASGGKYMAVPNHTMYSYSSYANSRSVYFKSLLDRNSLEHLQGIPAKNPFDKLMKFANNIETPPSTQTFFKVNNFYVLGYYIEEEKKYVLRKFY
ncbi:hypothetical protein [Marinifilum caeruleilacunae]|uniref:Uncharacterized protein n=1 Tax=Marinifilum caeruleilacunae TaxID=2499076 RepID=A0ABX1X0W9_9BACT|nr:hypothetical protein [Marinifilum caeruleilacunae]NOU61922.1 hypothetical protein [Marinifilum caeruleilacunae]